MIRSGIYCVFRGGEYKITRNAKGEILIITKNKSIIDESFVDKYGSGIYSKIVEEKELDQIYKINTIGQVGNLEVNIEGETEDSYLVGTSSFEIAQKLGLEQCDKYYHQGKVSKQKIVLKEEVIKIK